MATPAAGTDAGARRSGRGGDVLRGERRVVADRLAKRRGTVKFRPEKEEESMAASSSPDRRRRVACGVYEQPNGKYVGDWNRFRPSSLGPFLGLTPSEN